MFFFLGNHYGTPKPPKEPTLPPFRRTNSASTLLPGPHPSSEGKRRRNRSNVETTSMPKSFNQNEEPTTPGTRKRQLERSKSDQDLGSKDKERDIRERGMDFARHAPLPLPRYDGPADKKEKDRQEEEDRRERETGPLPPNWEMAWTEDGNIYFIE